MPVQHSCFSDGSEGVICVSVRCSRHPARPPRHRRRMRCHRPLRPQLLAGHSSTVAHRQSIVSQVYERLQQLFERVQGLLLPLALVVPSIAAAPADTAPVATPTGCVVVHGAQFDSWGGRKQLVGSSDEWQSDQRHKLDF